MQDSSSSSGPASGRSDEYAPGNWHDTDPITQNQNEKRNGSRDADDRLRDLPEWLEEFTDNLEDTETPVPAHVSQDSESERPTKRGIKIKEAMYCHSLPKRPELRSMFANQKYEGSFKKTHWRVPRAEKFGVLMKADHKVLNEEGESRNNHRYAVVAQDLATQWIQSCPCKTKKLHTRRKKEFRKFLEPSQQPKVIDTDNPLSLV